MTAPVTHLLYLHGFRSSPRSAKAERTAAWVHARHPQLVWWCPQLPPSPREAMALIEHGLRDWPAATTGIIGSSLGGYYATALAQRLGVRAVLLNPAVFPQRDLARHIGPTTSWHSDDAIDFRAEYIDELGDIWPGTLTEPQRYFAVIARADEVLSWEEMSARYRDCPQRLIDGSDHALSDYDAHLGAVMTFLGLDDVSART